MLNLDQLKAAVNNGELETAYRECRRYGTIISAVDHLWISGSVTAVTIQHRGRTFQFTLRLGVVVSAAFF